MPQMLGLANPVSIKQSTLEMGKHVIILGAGASRTSGYPLNLELGRILSSPGGFEGYLKAQDAAPQLTQKLIKEFRKEEEWLRPFLDGKFATVDDFSSEFRYRRKPVVQDLKWYTSWAFVLHNPQGNSGSCETGESTASATSDYLALVKKLFKVGSPRIRENIAILTYNYDAYFEFLLSGAFKGMPGHEHAQIPTAWVSGFGDCDADALLKAKGFCFLKLHGTSVLPLFFPPNMRRAHPLTFNEVFVDRAQLGKLPDPIRVGRPPTPPIFFPWELITEAGEFVTKDDFWGVDGTKDNRTYYPVFRAIWKRARQEITEADRISFVGFSAHEFMEHGLRFLFKARARRIKAGKKQPLEVVTADPKSMPKGHRGNTPPPGGHVDLLQKLLEKACPGLPFADLPSGKRGLGKIAC